MKATRKEHGTDGHVMPGGFCYRKRDLMLGYVSSWPNDGDGCGPDGPFVFAKRSSYGVE